MVMNTQAERQTDRQTSAWTVMPAQQKNKARDRVVKNRGEADGHACPIIVISKGGVREKGREA